MKRISASTTLDDLQADPSAYGVPTFAQFCAARDKFMGTDDQAMVSITDGPQKFRAGLEKIRYQLHGVDVGSEDMVERALSDHGYSLSDIDLDNRNSKLQKKIEMMPLGGGKYDLVVNFMP